MGNASEFRRAVRLVVDTVHFDKSNTVQVCLFLPPTTFLSCGLFKVFEANIRLLGSLLSAHLLMEDPNFPGLAPDWYLEDLLRFDNLKAVGNVDETIVPLFFIQ